MATAEKDCEQT